MAPNADDEELRPAWLSREEFPFRIREIETDAGRVAYVDEGSGPLLLFVHAGPAWCFVFRDVVRDLRRDFRCVALDFPGSGLAADRPREGGDGRRSPLDMASSTFRAFVEALDLRSGTLVAHDVGGPIALAVAGSVPDRFHGIVVVGSFAWPLRERHPRAHRMLRLVGGRLFSGLNAATNLLAVASSSRFGVGRRLSAEGRKTYRGPYRRARVRRHATEMLGSVATDTGERHMEWVLAAVRGPLSSLPWLLLYGEHDPGRRLGFDTTFRSMLTQAETAVVRGARHFPMCDFPVEVAERIRRWHGEHLPAGHPPRPRP